MDALNTMPLPATAEGADAAMEDDTVEPRKSEKSTALELPESNLRVSETMATLNANAALYHLPSLRVSTQEGEGKTVIFRGKPQAFKNLLDYPVFLSLLTQLIMGIELTWTARAVANADLIVLELVDVKDDPIVHLLTTVADGRDLPLDFGAASALTGVRAIAFVNMQLRSRSSAVYRPFTQDETVAVLGKIQESMEDIVALTKTDPLYHPGALGHSRRLQYENLVKQTAKLTHLAREELKLPHASFPQPTVQNARGRLTTTEVAPPLPATDILFLVVSVVAASPVARGGAGTRVMRAINGLADELQAHVLLRALYDNNQPLTFYLRLGFIFVRTTVKFDITDYMNGALTMLRQHADAGGAAAQHDVLQHFRIGWASALDLPALPSSLTPNTAAFLAKWDWNNLYSLRSYMLFEAQGELDQALANRTLQIPVTFFPVLRDRGTGHPMAEGSLTALFCDRVGTAVPARALKRPRSDPADVCDHEHKRDLAMLVTIGTHSQKPQTVRKALERMCVACMSKDQLEAIVGVWSRGGHNAEAAKVFEAVAAEWMERTE